MRPDGRYVGQEHPFFEIPTRGRGKRSGRSGAKGRLPSTGRTRALHRPARPYFPDAVSAMRRRAVDNDELLCHEDMDGDSPLEAARAKADLFCYEEMEKKKMPCKIIKLPSKKDEKQTKEVETSSFIHAPFPLPPLSPAPAQFSRKNPCLDKLVRHGIFPPDALSAQGHCRATYRDLSRFLASAWDHPTCDVTCVPSKPARCARALGKKK
jgi:hypothetical protein